MFSAAATSAAAASQSSHPQFGCSSVQRRRSNSAMAAYFLASEAALARAQPATGVDQCRIVETAKRGHVDRQ